MQSERLFESVERIDEQEAQSIRRKCGTLAYLQCSKRPEVVQRCEWFEEWFAQYPQEYRQKLKGQLKSRKSKKGNQFIEALFELEIYRMLYHRLGCKVQIEPDVSGQTPDFLAACKGERFYVEATVRHDAEADSSNRRHAEEFTDMLRAKLTNLHSNLGLSALDSSFPKQTNDWKIVYREIQKWLNSCSAEAVHTAYTQGDEVRQDFSIGNCQISVALYPREHEADIIGPAQIVQGSGVKILGDTVEKKAEKYKSQDFKDLPYIIAVNLSSVSSEWVQYTGSGEYNTEVAADADTDVARALCGNDSLTGREFFPKWKHVNGVIIVHNGTLGNEKIAGVKLYRNGNAAIPKCLQFLLEYNSFGSLLGLT